MRPSRSLPLPVRTRAPRQAYRCYCSPTSVNPGRCRVSRDINAYRWNTERRGEMRKARIDADGDLGACQQTANLIELQTGR